MQHLFIQSLIVVACVLMLYNLLGSPAFAAVAVLSLSVPVQVRSCVLVARCTASLAGLTSRRTAPAQVCMARTQRRLASRVMTLTDARVKLVDEVLSGVRLIKLYALERVFGARVGAVRAEEMAMMRKAACVRVINTVLMQSTPVLVGLATFAAYVCGSRVTAVRVACSPTQLTAHRYAFTGQALSPATAFTALALLGVLRVPFALLPKVVTAVIAGVVAIRRVEAFLNLPASAVT